MLDWQYVGRPTIFLDSISKYKGYRLEIWTTPQRSYFTWKVYREYSYGWDEKFIGQGKIPTLYFEARISAENFLLGYLERDE